MNLLWFAGTCLARSLDSTMMMLCSLRMARLRTPCSYTSVTAGAHQAWLVARHHSMVRPALVHISQRNLGAVIDCMSEWSSLAAAA